MSLHSRIKRLEQITKVRRLREADDADVFRDRQQLEREFAIDDRVTGVPRSHAMAKFLFKDLQKLKRSDLPDKERQKLEASTSRLKQLVAEQRERDFEDGKIDAEGNAIDDLNFNPPDGSPRFPK